MKISPNVFYDKFEDAKEEIEKFHRLHPHSKKKFKIELFTRWNIKEGKPSWWETPEGKKRKEELGKELLNKK